MSRQLPAVLPSTLALDALTRSQVDLAQKIYTHHPQLTKNQFFNARKPLTFRLSRVA